MNREALLAAIDQGQRNFSGEDFIEQDLSGLVCSELNLSDANCTGANLADSNFSNPEWNRVKTNTFYDPMMDLARPDWQRVNLTGANLAGAELRDVMMAHANLSQARLQETSFAWADLTGANFSGAVFGRNIGQYSWNGVMLKSVVAKFRPQDHLETTTDFTNSRLADARFDACFLHGAVFKKNTLTGASFRGAWLAHANFDLAQMEKADLSGACLEKASLDKANLTGARLVGTDLVEAYIGMADLTKADLTNADLTGSRLMDAVLYGAQLPGAKLSGAFMEKADLSGANLSDADLSTANLQSAILRQTKLTKTKLQDANLSGAQLDTTMLIGAQLNNANLTNASVQLSNLSNANLDKANCSGANMGYSIFNNASLIETDFKNSNLEHAKFDNAEFVKRNVLNSVRARIGSVFSNANMNGASFIGCFMPGVDMSVGVTDLSNANFHEAYLARSKFSDRIMKGTILSSANLEQVDFSNSNLEQADLSGSDIQQADFRGANLFLVNFSDTQWPELLPPKFNPQTRFIPKKWEDIFSRPSDNDVLAVQACFDNLSKSQIKDLTDSIGISQRIAFHGVLNRKVKSLVHLADAAEIVSYGDEDGVVDLKQLRKAIENYNVPMVSGQHKDSDMTDRPLVGTFIDRADLSGANMAQKNLSRAVISNSDLKGTNLRGADLTDAVLSNVDLTGADLRDTNLSGALLVNCNLDGVKLDGVVIDKARMIESTLKNLRVEQATIKDWLIQRSIVDDLTFAGGVGGGVNISGLGLYDSVMTNSRFGGNCQISGVELEGALMIADGGGLLNRDNVYVSPMSEWREQRILLLDDDILGPMRMERVVETGQIENKTSGIERMINWATRQQTPILTGLKIYDFVSDEQGGMGQLPVLEHMRHQKIGYQPSIAINPDWQPAQERKFILPASRAL